MVIGITITNTLRNHIPKLTAVYEGMTGKQPVNLPINPCELDLNFPTVVAEEEETEFDENQVAYMQDDSYLTENSEEKERPFDVYQLLYVDGSFEIFGNSDEIYPTIIKKVSDVARDS